MFTGIFLILFIYLFILLTVLGLLCCASFSQLVESEAYSLVVVCGLLTVEASLLQTMGPRAFGLQ